MLTIFGQNVRRSDTALTPTVWLCGNAIRIEKYRKLKFVATALIKLSDTDILELSCAGYQKRWKRQSSHGSQVYSSLILYDLNYWFFEKIDGTYMLENDNKTVTISGHHVRFSDSTFVRSSQLCGITILLPTHWTGEIKPTALIKLPDEDILELSFGGYERRWKKQ